MTHAKKSRGRPFGPCYAGDKEKVAKVMALLAEHPNEPVRDAIRTFGVNDERDIRRIERHVSRMVKERFEGARRSNVPARHHWTIGELTVATNFNPSLFGNIDRHRKMFDEVNNNILRITQGLAERTSPILQMIQEMKRQSQMQQEMSAALQATMKQSEFFKAISVTSKIADEMRRAFREINLPARLFAKTSK